ncbi:19S proteasome regulatory subunit Rpn12 [Schizosaccharomyces japonicus yFS275]|uniref:19S proteasome regulatory subunit Rpn12 n=1 Tax=Schizosaccharomyces japonicus (strain yFS275 / FY16936) TaxID=402676 RepID=B6K014_SCHJY|nr:19S proteasome regulatory subunit Rpn12 [Schizosaccharomyces japonicus yFS275]EEB06164.1 19S proteasome regulatory subunit Rpn12 [Schizosaccharomyces japonicus yFS275]
MADFDLKTLNELYEQKNWDGCKTELLRLKIVLARNDLLLPTDQEDTSCFARNVYEYGALVSVQIADIDSFARYANQVMPFYYCPSLAPSPRMGLVMALKMLYLLSENRIAEFHTALESMPDKTLFENDTYVKWVMSLEQNVMEGAFDKVARSINECNVLEFSYFMNIVMSMVRNEIASCAEKVYSTLPLTNATSLLFLKGTAETERLAAERNWTVKNGMITFPKETQTDSYDMDMDEESTSDLNLLDPKHDAAVKNIRQLLGYTAELEQIV